jgi:hypothetical protein
MTDSPPGDIRYVIPPSPKDISEVIYKGFVEASFALFEKGYAVSGIKLLLSAIDTMAFLRTGQGNSSKDFKAWLEKYVDLSSVGIDPDELWEHRCALLHMTTFHSKAVHQGKIKFLIPSYGEPPERYADAVKAKYEAVYGTNYTAYSIDALIKAVFLGVDKFLKEVDSDPKLKALVVSNLGEVVPDIPMVATRTQ